MLWKGSNSDDLRGDDREGMTHFMAVMLNSPNHTFRLGFRWEACQAKQNDAFGELMPLEDKGSEIFVRGYQQGIDLRSEGQYFFIRQTGFHFSNIPYLMPGLAQGIDNGPINTFICQEFHRGHLRREGVHLFKA